MLRRFALALAFVVAIGLNVSEGSTLPICTWKWRSNIRTYEQLLETLKSDVKGMEPVIEMFDGEPIFAWPSRMPVEKFIDQVIDYHNNGLENELPTKDVVFYFPDPKDITVIQKTVDILKRKENEINFPIWLRAEIAMAKSRVALPDAIGFTEQVLRLNNAVLGVRFASDGFTKTDTDNIFEMLKRAKALENKGLAINIFFRGYFLVGQTVNQGNLKELFENLKKTNPVTFTMIGDEQYSNDLAPDFTILREAIKFLGPENVYLQVSDEKREHLDLRGLFNHSRYQATNSARLHVQMNFIALIPSIAVTFIGIFCFH